MAAGHSGEASWLTKTTQRQEVTESKREQTRQTGSVKESRERDAAAGSPRRTLDPDLHSHTSEALTFRRRARKFNEDSFVSLINVGIERANVSAAATTTVFMGVKKSLIFFWPQMKLLGDMNFGGVNQNRG